MWQKIMQLKRTVRTNVPRERRNPQLARPGKEYKTEGVERQPTVSASRPLNPKRESIPK